ncbi:mxaD protein [Haloactinopolyspora alba]|uniref:MxaD protein n=2 Tax=Haloactinopolyspora alba TaxID=648780 RepID=A0A2P8DN91_9ACTN|nr:mxaD protein [Haloactinopolyspora alba]
MPHAEATATIATDADTLWRVAGDFGSVGAWHPWLTSTSTDGAEPGARRTAIAADGSQQIEQLVHIDPANRYYRYTMESTPLPVADYVAEFRIDPIDGSSCVIRWTADFRATSGQEADAVDTVQSFLAAGVEELRQRHA